MSEAAVVREPDRNLALELVRATEAAALGASRWVGRGGKDAADKAAVDAMRALLRTVSMRGVVAAEAISLEVSAGENVRRVAEAKGKPAADVTVVVLDRDRNVPLIAALREVGAQVSLIPHGDTAPAVATALRRSDEPVDLVMGIGGSTEGILAAAAVKCLGGGIQARLWPRDEADRRRLTAGVDYRRPAR